MLSNAYFLANFGFDTAENEAAKNLQILDKVVNLASRRGRVQHAGARAAARLGRAAPRPHEARARRASERERRRGGVCVFSV